MFSRKQVKYLFTYWLLSITSPIYAIIINPPPPYPTVVTTSETIEYNVTSTASSSDNLNINNFTLPNQTYNVNVRTGGWMENTSILRDDIVINGNLSHDVYILVENGGKITRNSITEEIIDDDSTSTGTVSLTVNAGGYTFGLGHFSANRTANEIHNAGTIEGDNQNLTLVNNTGSMLGSMSLLENGILNNDDLGTISGTISGTGPGGGTQFNIGQSIASDFIASASIFDVDAINLFNNSSLTVDSGTVSGFTSMTGAGPLTINPSGTVQIDSANALAITGPIINSGNLNVNNVFDATISSAFTNPNGSINVLGDGAIIGDITASGTSVLTIGGFTPTDFTTQGTIDGFETVAVVLATLTTQHTISNVLTVNSAASTINLGADILILPSGTFNNPSFFGFGGSIYVSGNRSLGAGSYTGDLTNQYFTITNGTVYDSLTTTGDINIDTDTINISSSFTGTGTWEILKGATISHSNTIVNPPADTAFNTWSYDYSGTSLFLNSISSAVGFMFTATTEFNAKVLDVLNVISTTMANAGQQELVNQFRTYTSQESFNSGLQQLIPNLNASAPDVMLQNDVFNRIETRIAAITNPYSGMTGMVAGDLNPSTSMWLGGFGSVAEQQAIDENPGYNSNSFGMIIGMDKLMRNNGVFGFGLAFSRNIIKEKSNPNFTTGVDGYHAVTYANHCFKHDKFLESLATAALTNSSGSRAININGAIMSTTSSYSGAQAGFRFNYGKRYNFADIFNFAPLATMQYALLYAPDYNEAYSPAALHVAPTNYQNVLTFGGGIRFSAPPDEWLFGTREVRALVTYDAISSDNLTTANFLVGSPNFAVSTTPERLALKLGIDFTFNVMRCTQIAFEYDYELRHKYTDHSGTLKVRYLF